MASRIMHLAVASELCNRLNIENTGTFLLGSLAPDLVHHGTDEYRDSHFGQICEGTQTRGVNWEGFVNKYDHVIRTDEFLQGYLVHLVTDACWVKLIQEQFIRIYPECEQDQITLKGYSDVRKLNKRIIDQFSLKYELTLTEDLGRIQLDEIDIALLDSLLEDLKADFKMDESFDFELDVYTNEAIDSFLVESINKSTSELQRIKKGLSCSDPKGYFVK